MRAVVYDRYGPPEVLRLEDVERPVPRDDEVLIKVRATTVTRTDVGLRSANPFITRFVMGLRRPKRRILGVEMAGEIEAVGSGVTEFKMGDEVFGASGLGAHAEFVCLRQSAPIAHKPADVTFDEAAAVTDGATLAFACLRSAGLLEDKSVLVYGASGSVGTAAVQLAKVFGAQVTAVCSTRHLELVKSLGADEAIDYTQEDFTRNGKTYDAILDAFGKLSFRRSRGSLKPGGMFLATDGLGNLPLALLTRWIGDKRLVFGITRYSKKDVVFLKGLIDAGRYRAVIDRRYPLEQVVEATRYVETGRKTGNVVLTVTA
jgi:NADPH:quinone reductase-like Zn-dependent oxidoreductase